jgi:hypothetical protein
MNDSEGNTPMIFITGSVIKAENMGWLKFLMPAHIPHITGLQSSPNFTDF